MPTPTETPELNYADITNTTIENLRSEGVPTTEAELEAKDEADAAKLRDALTSDKPFDGGKEIQTPFTLSDEDNERLRAIVQQQQPIVRLPDGSIRIMFTLSPELAIPLEAWAEGAGEPFESYAQNFLETALTATILGANVG